MCAVRRYSGTPCTKAQNWITLSFIHIKCMLVAYPFGTIHVILTKEWVLMSTILSVLPCNLWEQSCSFHLGAYNPGIVNLWTYLNDQPSYLEPDKNWHGSRRKHVMEKAFVITLLDCSNITNTWMQNTISPFRLNWSISCPCSAFQKSTLHTNSQQDRPSQRTFVSTEPHAKVWAELLADRFGNGPNWAQRMLHVTTQQGARSAIRVPISRQYRADRVLGVKQLNGEFSTDTVYGKIKSLLNGECWISNILAQLWIWSCILPPSHSTCPISIFSRGNSGISSKRHMILIEHDESYLQLYIIKYRRICLNLHFRIQNKKSWPPPNFPYIVHVHGSWQPLARWGSCSWGQSNERPYSTLLENRAQFIAFRALCLF
jgi:hypothetical protein